MKQKLKSLWSRWNAFRREKLFSTPKEVRVLMLTYREILESSLGLQRDKFKNACKEFAAIRTLTRKKFVYRLEYEIDAALLESSAGAEAGAGAIAVELAKEILQRHAKHTEDICEHEAIALTPTGYSCQFCRKILTAKERNERNLKLKQKSHCNMPAKK